MSEQELRTYYNYVYPFDTLVNWLTYNNSTPLMHRQLSFEYQPGSVERYVVFADAQNMKSRMIDYHLRTPSKVDAGAIWSRRPQKDSNIGKTVERQFIFDIDMNDYDDVRTCCTGKKVCKKCWKLVIVAAQILEQTLAEDFDFHKLLYVFSGGRGLHIWVCDKKARQLQDFVRKGMVDYMQLVTGNNKASSLLGQNVIGKVQQNHLWKKLDESSRQVVKKYYMNQYTSNEVERSLKIINKYFLEIMQEQNMFGLDENGEFKNMKFLQVMFNIINHRSKELSQKIAERWKRKRGKSAQEMFAEMDLQIAKYETSITTQDYNAGRAPGNKVYRLTFILQEIMLSFMYPRIDHNVSTMQNHLLKLPFSVHPSSKKISIPLSKKQLIAFDPVNCVTINGLLSNIDYDNLSDNNETNAEKVGLKWPINALEEFIKNLSDDE